MKEGFNECEQPVDAQTGCFENDFNLKLQPRALEKLTAKNNFSPYIKHI